MRHDQLDHIIGAAGDLLGVDEMIVIGSQAILASFEELPAPATISLEADILPPGGEVEADLIDGALGELSGFHEAFGIYAAGVGPETATLPAGWEERLVRYTNPNTNGVTALCVEPHDLVISKLYAGREKDLSFCRALIEAHLVGPDLLSTRIDELAVSAAEKKEVGSRLDRLVAEIV
jgi:hypothetical protein